MKMENENFELLKQVVSARSKVSEGQTVETGADLVGLR